MALKGLSSHFDGKNIQFALTIILLLINVECKHMQFSMKFHWRFVAETSISHRDTSYFICNRKKERKKVCFREQNAKFSKYLFAKK